MIQHLNSDFPSVAALLIAGAGLVAAACDIRSRVHRARLLRRLKEHKSSSHGVAKFRVAPRLTL
jgi:hypothetical protein